MNMHPQGGVANGGQRPNAGVDVCKQHLDVCLGTEHQRVANDAGGWDVLTAKFKESGVDLVVLEATGGYERGLVCALQGAAMGAAAHAPEWQKGHGAVSRHSGPDDGQAAAENQFRGFRTR